MALESFTKSLGSLVDRAAPSQAGIIDGDNPAEFNTNDPLRLWVIQIGIILIFCQGLAFIGKRIRQPRVIAEVIGGLLLGPSAFGRIPGFSKNIFPTQSLPYLNLTSTIALVLYLFVIGLETDVSTMRRLLKRAGPISIAGMLLPFGLGAAIAVPIYNTFVDHDKVTFGHFTLFTCVAMSITAFPVLCRILTELKLLDTTVGIVVLAAGVGNDVVGWVLLALTVTLVNATSGVSAVYVLLCGVGWTLFMLFPVRVAFHYVAKRTGSLESGTPTTSIMMLTFLMVFTSAFFTDIIGIHAIFGGFLAGLVIPHEGGFAIALCEKIEDLITILLLPIYFALSGLKTDLGSLNTGKAWGYAILLIVVAFFGKFIGCVGTAKLVGFNNRESGAIGALMSCKGLVELIVLNVGLQAGILDTKLFSMFVFMAIILTLMTTPLTLLIYPPHVRKVIHEPSFRSSDDSSDEKAASRLSALPSINKGAKAGVPSSMPIVSRGDKFKFTVVLERIEHLPAVMTIVQLFQPPSSSSVAHPSRPAKIDALRLVELSERMSAVMRGNDAGEVLRRDALVKVFEMFARLNRIAVSSALSVVPHADYAPSVVQHAQAVGSELILLPWSAAPLCHPSEGQSNAAQPSTPHATSSSHYPLLNLFGAHGTDAPTENSVLYAQFIRGVFVESSADVGLVVDRGAPNSTNSSHLVAVDGHHLFLPFFGGPDDRLALTLLVQLCQSNPSVSATVVWITKSENDLERSETVDSVTKDKEPGHPNFTITSVGAGFPDTIYAQPTTETRMTSQTADHVLWSRVNSSETSRIAFAQIQSPQPLTAALEYLSDEVIPRQLSPSSNPGAKGPNAQQPAPSKGLIVALGRARRMAVESHQAELREIASTSRAQSTGELRKTVGDVASAFIISTPHQLLVFQASPRASSEV